MWRVVSKSSRGGGSEGSEETKFKLKKGFLVS